MKNRVISRYIVIWIFLAVAVFFCVWRLVDLQIINGEKYMQLSLNRVSSNLVIKAPRGEILDRYGRPLVNNRIGYSVLLQKTDISNDEFNELIYNLTHILDSEYIEYITSMPVTNYPYQFNFTDDNDSGDSEDEKAAWLKGKKFSADATAEHVVNEYAKKYKISADKYTPEQIKSIIDMRYELEQRGLSTTMPCVIAQDVDINLLTKVRENKEKLPGVTVTTNYIRNYVEGDLAAHILGRIGVIYEDEYQQLKTKGYTLNDLVGKQGIEKVFEDSLRGIDGMQSVQRSINGELVEITAERLPVAGENVVLTLDSNLQKAAEDSLKSNIHKIASQGGAKTGADCVAGAAVVLDVSNGDVLASATYPTYNPATFNQDYSQLASNPAKPLINRVISGTYPPGSTFKMLPSVAGLEEGIITPTTTIVDQGVFKKYPGQQPACWIWNDRRATHGAINVSKAIEVSCNYFFYELGDNLGIDKMLSYARLFGFGEKTGLELSNEEKSGTLASPQVKEKIEPNNKKWYPGDTIRFAIGQSYNAFTPIQLANYVATLVNGGNRYQTRLVKSTHSLTDSKLSKEYPPTVLSTVKMKDSTVVAIANGMKNVVEQGTASSIFGSDYQIAIGGKTGTAQVGNGSPHAVFVGYAPFDNPQIAVCVVLEHGAKGGNAAYVARDIFDAYFMTQPANEVPVEFNTLIR